MRAGGLSLDPFHILIADGDPDIRSLIRIHVQRAGMTAHEAVSGSETITKLRERRFDLLVLDLMMDDLDGFEVLRHIRSESLSVLVIVLSARRGLRDKIEALSLGADDYVTKPFSPIELVARMQANLRRYGNGSGAVQGSIRLNALALHADNFTLYREGEPVSLTPMEFELIRLFMQNPDQVLTKTEIYKQIWKHEQYDDNTLSVFVSRLRKKIEPDPLSPRFLQTVRGIGYRFSGDGL